jgi:glycosyltransferase involved in cell wall biosynthesis
MLLSIIVPAFKVADYIEKCIRSLEDQDVPKEDYEIIVTNDGSPDDCQEIVERLQKEFSNIVLINQENQGVSMARNNAIAVAKGKYMMPIDPDDYVVTNCLRGVIDQAETDELDVLYCSFEIFDVNHQSIFRTDYAKLTNRIDIGYDGFFTVKGPNTKDPNRSWAILYRMGLVQKFQLWYPKDVPILEDGLFLIKIFTVANRVGYSNADFYQRTTRLGSAINSDMGSSDYAINGFVLATIDLRNFASNNNFNKNQIALINHGMANFILLALFPSVRFELLERFRKTCSQLKSLGFNKINTLGVKDCYNSYAKAYNISSYLFFLLYSKDKFKQKFLINFRCELLKKVNGTLMKRC